MDRLNKEISDNRESYKQWSDYEKSKSITGNFDDDVDETPKKRRRKMKKR